MQSFVQWIDGYIDTLQQFIASQAILAPLLLLFVEESGIPLFIPGDAVLAYVGYTTSLHPGASLLVTFALATAAVAGGSTILFFVSRRWGHIVVRKLGKFLFIDETDIESAERLFKKYGWWAILFGRHIPGMRIPLTVFAGISGMQYRTFILATLASTLAWIALFLNIGHRYGHSIDRMLHHSVRASFIILFGIVALVLGAHLWGRYHRRKRAR